MEKNYRPNKLTSHTQIFIGPPGVGKTTFKHKHPGRFIDPEDSINWKIMDQRYGLYPFSKFRDTPHALYEHELDWSSIWTEEIFPRVFLALSLKKDLIMGLITPLNIEAISRFLSAFYGQAKLILPSEEEHYRWAWNDNKKRPRTWGPEFRTWKNTYWLRLLLRGLAEELHIQIVKSPTCLAKMRLQKEKFANRKGVDRRGNIFVETFFNRWAELDVHKDIIAMYRSVMTLDGSINIQCDKTAKGCGRGSHRCDLNIVLQNDITGRPLSNWIAREKMRPFEKKKKNAVIFFVGTLAPFHYGHLNLLDGAKLYLESLGWNVAAGYASTFVSRKEERIGELYPMLGSIDHRNAILQLGALSSDWLMVDFPVEHVLHSSLLKNGKHPSQRIAKRLRDCGAINSKIPVTIFWVNGADAYLDKDFFRNFAEYANVDLLNPLRMLIVENRSGKNNWSKKNVMQTVPEVDPFILRYRNHMKNPTSATAIRNAMLSGDRIALRKLIGLPLVESYLLGILQKYVSVK